MTHFKFKRACRMHLQPNSQCRTHRHRTTTVGDRQLRVTNDAQRYTACSSYGEQVVNRSATVSRLPPTVQHSDALIGWNNVCALSSKGYAACPWHGPDRKRLLVADPPKVVSYCSVPPINVAPFISLAFWACPRSSRNTATGDAY
jgi:hypothetical protein